MLETCWFCVISFSYLFFFSFPDALKELDDAYERYRRELDSLQRRKLQLSIQRALIRSQELGDEKIQIAGQMVRSKKSFSCRGEVAIQWKIPKSGCVQLIKTEQRLHVSVLLICFKYMWMSFL